MKATSSRRQLIVFVLLAFAVLGGAVRHWADQPSVARDIGTLLLVLWLPIIGNVVAFVITRLHLRSRRRIDFEPGAAFAGELLVELTPISSAALAVAPDEHCCTLAIGAEGFTGRLPVAVAQWFAGGQTQAVQLQFLRPALALRRFPVDAVFSVLAGRTVVGSGRVLRQLG